MKRQIIILTVVYLVVMLLGFWWCYQYIDFEVIFSDLLIKSLISALCSYCGYFILRILDAANLLVRLMDKMKMVMTYIIYVYMAVFLYEAFIGLVMVFVFKEYVYAYAFFSVLTVLHATKLSRKVVEYYNTY